MGAGGQGTLPLNVTSMLLWHPHIQREPDPRQGELPLSAAGCENESDLGTTSAAAGYLPRVSRNFWPARAISEGRTLKLSGEAPTY